MAVCTQCPPHADFCKGILVTPSEECSCHRLFEDLRARPWFLFDSVCSSLMAPKLLVSNAPRRTKEFFPEAATEVPIFTYRDGIWMVFTTFITLTVIVSSYILVYIIMRCVKNLLKDKEFEKSDSPSQSVSSPPKNDSKTLVNFPVVQNSCSAPMCENKPVNKSTSPEKTKGAEEGRAKAGKSMLTLQSIPNMVSLMARPDFAPEKKKGKEKKHRILAPLERDAHKIPGVNSNRIPKQMDAIPHRARITSVPTPELVRTPSPRQISYDRPYKAKSVESTQPSSGQHKTFSVISVTSLNSEPAVFEYAESVHDSDYDIGFPYVALSKNPAKL
uniref:TPX2_importin domain-containing protein n=2 Tax=Steinernema glaseri TaxID=37863 RepID=A0A1I7ZUW4_9BILA